MTQHVLISKLEYFKHLATCFSYNEPSSDHKQNKVMVHSMIVHSMGSHIVYIECTITECTMTLFCFWPDDGSL